MRWNDRLSSQLRRQPNQLGHLVQRDAIAEATIDWEKYRPHLKEEEEIDAAGMAKDCAKLDELGQEVAKLSNTTEVLITYVFRWGVQTGCWEDD